MSRPLLPVFHILLLAAAFSSAHASQLINRFGTCPELNNYYVNKLLPHVGPYGLTGNLWANTRPANGLFTPGTPGGPAGIHRPPHPPRVKAYGNLSALSPEAEELDEAGPQAGLDFSTTNVQVKGVDEPDIIKTDGKRVFTLSGNVFSVVRVLDAGRRGRRVGKLVLPTSPTEMLIEGDFLLVIANDYSYRRPVQNRYKNHPSGAYRESTIIYQIDVSKPWQPRLVSTLQLEGAYVKSRERDGVARLILRFDPLSPLWLFYPSGKISTAQTRKWNQDIVQQSQPGHWLPTYRLRRGSRVQAGVYATCDDIYYSGTTFAGFKLLTVVTLRVDGLMVPKSSASIISDADTVYSNKESMYITTTQFRFDTSNNNAAWWGGKFHTAFHKFNLTDDGATYVASGRISGSVINQFAMHEVRGIFFIATTDGASWWTSRDLSKSKVSAFKVNPRTRRLNRIGQVGNLGVGERIFAVRYRGETAYVVTFRQVDPLYIIDLSKPWALRVTGELKIPGYSSYLHQVGPGRILGVGQEATLTGRLLGAKVSLFDVSDKSNPKELSSWSLQGSYTNAEWDHRAFLYWWRERIAVMPVNVYSGSETFSGAIVLDVSDTKITERGRVVQRYQGYSPSILRNAILGGKYLWSMSSELLQVNNVKKLKNVQSRVKISN